MVSGDYLRSQAKTCLAWARECFDLGTATRLRLMAEEFMAKAEELDAACEANLESYRSTLNPAAFQARGHDS
jgi:hypothetical protein